MKPFILFFALLSSTAFALPEPDFRFSYEPNEGAEGVNCTHERIRDLPDWKIRCPFFGETKEFTAHVVLREMPRKEGTLLEILYWVTAPGEAPGKAPKFHSTSALIRLKGESSLSGLSLAQGVENDYASLVLHTGTAVYRRSGR